MLKVQMLEHVVSNEATTPREHIQLGASAKRLSSSSMVDGAGGGDCKTPTTSPVHQCHPATQRHMTSGSIKSASQGSSPAG